MPELRTSSYRTFRDVQRLLMWRRFQGIDIRLRIELVALFSLLGGFLFWQSRLFLDSLSRSRGALGVAFAEISICLGLALLGGALAGQRHAYQLRRGVAGPPWLALPVPADWVARHIAWEARAHAWWAALLAPGILASAVGLLGLPWMLLIAAGLVGTLEVTSRLGCMIAQWWILRSAERRTGLPPIVRALATAAWRSAVGAARTAPWRSCPAWQALWTKDLLLARRVRSVRRRLLMPLMLGALSVACWALPAPPPLLRAGAFALALAASASLGEWLIALSGEDPFPVLRGLPVAVSTVWGARALWAVLAAAILVIAHGFMPSPLDLEARQVFLVWTGGASLLVTILAANYGITLFPRAEVASRLLGLSLGLAVASSLMIPLAGWVTLLAANLHSLRRLPRWNRLEDER